MSNPNYDRKKVRRGMLLAPVAALLGIAPFALQLNLTFGQFLLAAVAALLVSYIAAILFGTPGYLLLKRLGYPQPKYLMAYAVLLTVLTPIILGDIYATLTFGPPTLLAAATFCLLRGPTVETAEISIDNA